MSKNKRYALFTSVLAAVFAFALGIFGYVVLDAGEQAPAAMLFWHHFFFIATPGLMALSIISIARIKE